MSLLGAAGIITLGDNSTNITDTFLSVTNNPRFAYDFVDGLTDISGNGYNTAITNGCAPTYSNDGPQESPDIITVNGCYTPMPALSHPYGNQITLIGIVKVPANGFGNNILWMGGVDSYSSINRKAMSISFWGNSSDPRICCDYARNNFNKSIDISAIDKWMTVVVEYEAGVGVSLYYAVQGANQYIHLGTDPVNVNMPTSNGTNYLFSWSAIRYFIGSTAFVGACNDILAQKDLERFILK